MEQKGSVRREQKKNLTMGKVQTHETSLNNNSVKKNIEVNNDPPFLQTFANQRAT